MIINGLVEGKILIGNHRFSHEIWDFPLIFPLNQPIDCCGDVNVVEMASFILWLEGAMIALRVFTYSLLNEELYKELQTEFPNHILVKEDIDSMILLGLLSLEMIKIDELD